MRCAGQDCLGYSGLGAKGCSRYSQSAHVKGRFTNISIDFATGAVRQKTKLFLNPDVLQRITFHPGFCPAAFGIEAIAAGA
jgi:hypothetical protein